MPSEKPSAILIIDDEKAIRSSFRTYLEDYLYTVLEAENGRVGLEVFEREKPDLVLVDLRMPEIDGITVLAKIMETSPNTPMIVVSGTGVIDDAIEALHCGAWDYLLKPIEDMVVLRHSVERALERARLIKENLSHQEHLRAEVARRTKELERANKELRQINKRLRRVVETTKSISACSRVEQFGLRLLNEFSRHMHAAGGSLYLLEEEGLQLVHSLDPAHAAEFIPYPLQEGAVLERTLTEGEPVLIPNIKDLRELSTSGWDGYKGSSVLVLPLSGDDGSIVGLLSLHSKSPMPFTEQDKEIGSILASYSCEALRAARATEALHKAHNELELRVERRTEELVKANEKLQHEIETRKRLEKALMQKEKLKTLGAIAAEVAHEIRNPLVAIGGFAKRLKHKIPDLQECDIILNESQRLEKILSRIRHYLEPVEIHPKECSVNTIINDCLNLLSPETEHRNVKCQMELTPELPAAYVDPEILAQTFINLIRNATKAMDKGGTLLISSFESRQDLHIEFKNEAQGIKVEHSEALFMPFAEGGQSFGLPICYRLLKDMGGLLSLVQEDSFMILTVVLPKAGATVELP